MLASLTSFSSLAIRSGGCSLHLLCSVTPGVSHVAHQQPPLLTCLWRQPSQALHTSTSVSHPSPSNAQDPTQPSSEPSSAPSQPSTSQPIQNPLQSVLSSAAAAVQSPLSGLSTDLRSLRGRNRPAPRTWMWYDETEEREERQRERRRQYPDKGHAHYLNVPQSMKKMNRIMRLVRGLHYEEAIQQCKLVPHKAARFVIEALDHAKSDAVEKKLQPDLLVVDTIYVTKGIYNKDMQPMGKGNRGKKYTRKSHLRVVLREDDKYDGFRARLVSPRMGTLPNRYEKFPYQYVV